MKEIVELNKRIMIEAPGVVPAGEDCLFVSRDGKGDKEADSLPPAIKADLNAICERLNALVPNDFHYVLCLGDYNPAILLEFRDGAMAFATCGETFDPERSIYEQLEKVDWQKHREFGMKGGQFFDGVREMSKEVKPMLPSTSEIQQKFRNELESFAKAKRTGLKRIFLLKWREDEGVTEESCDSMKDLRGDLYDLMTCQYSIIGVIVDKKLLPPRKVDKLKRAVLEEMKDSMPISYVKASGLFA